MTDIIVSNLIGLVVGLVTSFSTWWLLFHGIVPRIAFATGISKLQSNDDGSGYKYRFKFANVGSRALLDVQLVARISIKGLQFPTSWSTITIPLDWSGDKKVEIPRIAKKNNRVLRLFLNQSLDLKQSGIFPEDIRQKTTRSALLLEDVLRLGTEAKLTVYVSGYDELSGARKVFQSKPYSADDVCDGRFKKLDVVPAISGFVSTDEEDHAQSTENDAQQGVPGDAPQAAGP